MSYKNTINWLNESLLESIRKAKEFRVDSEAKAREYREENEKLRLQLEKTRKVLKKIRESK